MSRHQTRQKLAKEFGATDIVNERGDGGVARIKELTKGIGADSVLDLSGCSRMRKSLHYLWTYVSRGLLASGTEALDGL
jgi:threonine dehydrogenase-like Zn-dependent dehydrogenase